MLKRTYFGTCSSEVLWHKCCTSSTNIWILSVYAIWFLFRKAYLNWKIITAVYFFVKYQGFLPFGFHTSNFKSRPVLLTRICIVPKQVCLPDLFKLLLACLVWTPSSPSGTSRGVSSSIPPSCLQICFALGRSNQLAMIFVTFLEATHCFYIFCTKTTLVPKFLRPSHLPAVILLFWKLNSVCFFVQCNSRVGLYFVPQFSTFETMLSMNSGDAGKNETAPVWVEQPAEARAVAGRFLYSADPPLCHRWDPRLQRFPLKRE